MIVIHNNNESVFVKERHNIISDVRLVYHAVDAYVDQSLIGLSAMLNLARQYALTENGLVKLGHISFKLQWVITN